MPIRMSGPERKPLITIPNWRFAVVGEVYRMREFPAILREVSPHGGDSMGRWVCLSCGITLATDREMRDHRDTPAPRNVMLEKRIGPHARHILGWFSHLTSKLEEPEPSGDAA